MLSRRTSQPACEKGLKRRRYDHGKGVGGTKLDPVLRLLDSVIAKHTIRKVMGS